jgi:hypothetical protein
VETAVVVVTPVVQAFKLVEPDLIYEKELNA